jgi:uncharacterized protein (TIGR00106 family)
MAIIDVAIIPIGTEGSSVSLFVASIQKILKKHEEKGDIQFQLTPMSTLIEGELSTLLKVVEEIHESPFKEGIQRVATNIRIDDRCDKTSTMSGKLASVQKKLVD